MSYLTVVPYNTTVMYFTEIWTSYDFKKKPFIPVSLEACYLHVKTSIAVKKNRKSGKKLEILFFNESYEFVSGITILFEWKSEYKLDKCMKKSRPFDTHVPTELHRLWSIEKRGMRIIVSCNGVKVLDFTATSKTCDDEKWNALSWGSNVVEMKFALSEKNRNMNNKAKKFYFLGKGSHVFSSFQNFPSICSF